MTTEYEDTKVKSTSQKTGGNTVKPQIHKPKKLVQPKFDDKKYGIKSPRIEQHSQQRELGHLKPSGFLKSIIGRFLASFVPKIINDSTQDKLVDRSSKAEDVAKITKLDGKHTKGVGSELKGSNIEKIVKEKDHSHTK